MSRILLGTGITNREGVAKLDTSTSNTALTHSYTGTGAGELNITATTGVLESSTLTVWDYLFYDEGVTGAKNTNWTNYNNRATVEVTEEGTDIINTASSNAYYFVKNSAYIFEDYECTFDIVSTGNYGLVRWYIQAEDTSNQVAFIFNSYVNQPCSIRITCKNNAVNVYTKTSNDDDWVLKTDSPITVTVTGPYEIGFRFNGNMTEGTNFIYKNFKIWSI